jgi:hypothetical protein
MDVTFHPDLLENVTRTLAVEGEGEDTRVWVRQCSYYSGYCSDLRKDAETRGKKAPRPNFFLHLGCRPDCCHKRPLSVHCSPLLSL